MSSMTAERHIKRMAYPYPLRCSWSRGSYIVRHNQTKTPTLSIGSELLLTSSAFSQDAKSLGSEVRKDGGLTSRLFAGVLNT
jgi:hypothetical protein